MCELMTIAAAIVFTVIYFRVRRTPAVFTTMLRFWGAALMWSVDCGHAAMEEGLSGMFDLSLKDTLLGCISLAAGVAVFGVLSFFARRRTPVAA